MSILVIGGTGFIGRRVVRRLAAGGNRIVCLRFSQGAGVFGDLADKVEFRAGDVTRFDDVMRIMADVRPARVVNLAY